MILEMSEKRLDPEPDVTAEEALNVTVPRPGSVSVYESPAVNAPVSAIPVVPAVVSARMHVPVPEELIVSPPEGVMSTPSLVHGHRTGRRINRECIRSGIERFHVSCIGRICICVKISGNCSHLYRSGRLYQNLPVSMWRL